jgi:hypothetical protein
MAQLISLPLWAKCDEKDKSADYPDGAFMLSGHLDIEGIDLTLKSGQKIGIAIRRNKNKTNDRAPDYYGELYSMTERADAPAQPPKGGQS